MERHQLIPLGAKDKTIEKNLEYNAPLQTESKIIYNDEKGLSFYQVAENNVKGIAKMNSPTKTKGSVKSRISGNILDSK